VVGGPPPFLLRYYRYPTNGSIPGADATMALAAPKIGLRHADQVGHLYVADISVPPAVLGALGASPAPDFSHSSIVRLLLH